MPGPMRTYENLCRPTQTYVNLEKTRKNEKNRKAYSQSKRAVFSRGVAAQRRPVFWPLKVELTCRLEIPATGPPRESERAGVGFRHRRFASLKPALTRSQRARQTPGNISIKVVFNFNKGCLSFNKGCFSNAYTIKRKKYKIIYQV